MLHLAWGRSSCIAFVWHSRARGTKIILSVEAAPRTRVTKSISTASIQLWNNGEVTTPYDAVRARVMGSTLAARRARPVCDSLFLQFQEPSLRDHSACVKVTPPNCAGTFLQFAGKPPAPTSYFGQLPVMASPAKAFFTKGVESTSEPLTVPE